MAFARKKKLKSNNTLKEQKGTNPNPDSKYIII